MKVLLEKKFSQVKNRSPPSTSGSLKERMKVLLEKNFSQVKNESLLERPTFQGEN